MEIGNQNHRRRGKSVLSMVLLWEEEISDYREKIKYYRYRNLRLMEKMNILEGDWRGKCDCEIFCFFLRGEGGERRKRGRIIKFYFDFARGEFLLYV